MKRVMTAVLAGALAASLGACGKAEDPADVRADAGEAEMEAREDVARAQSGMDQRLMEDQQARALAEAESEHEIAMERCETLPAADQAGCKMEADARLEAARAAAEQQGRS